MTVNGDKYDSIYTGEQIDEAVGKVIKAETEGGVVSHADLDDYVSSNFIANATVTGDGSGDPSVSITKSGTANQTVLNFAFNDIKGSKGSSGAIQHVIYATAGDNTAGFTITSFTSDNNVHVGDLALIIKIDSRGISTDVLKVEDIIKITSVYGADPIDTYTIIGNISGKDGAAGAIHFIVQNFTGNGANIAYGKQYEAPGINTSSWNTTSTYGPYIILITSTLGTDAVEQGYKSGDIIKAYLQRPFEDMLNITGTIEKLGNINGDSATVTINSTSTTGSLTSAQLNTLLTYEKAVIVYNNIVLHPTSRDIESDYIQYSAVINDAPSYIIGLSIEISGLTWGEFKEEIPVPPTPLYQHFITIFVQTSTNKLSFTTSLVSTVSTQATIWIQLINLFKNDILYPGSGGAQLISDGSLNGTFFAAKRNGNALRCYFVPVDPTSIPTSINDYYQFSGTASTKVSDYVVSLF